MLETGKGCGRFKRIRSVGAGVGNRGLGGYLGRRTQSVRFWRNGPVAADETAKGLVVGMVRAEVKVASWAVGKLRVGLAVGFVACREVRRDGARRVRARVCVGDLRGVYDVIAWF